MERSEGKRTIADYDELSSNLIGIALMKRVKKKNKQEGQTAWVDMIDMGVGEIINQRQRLTRELEAGNHEGSGASERQREGERERGGREIKGRSGMPPESVLGGEEGMRKKRGGRGRAGWMAYSLRHGQRRWPVVDESSRTSRPDHTCRRCYYTHYYWRQHARRRLRCRCSHSAG
jgi:hypothetical protein